LYGVVGEMDAAVADFESVFRGGGADVAFVVPVAFHASVGAVEHDVVPEVELAFLVEEGSLYVFL
jgi:hypothetical protein